MPSIVSMWQSKPMTRFSEHASFERRERGVIWRITDQIDMTLLPDEMMPPAQASEVA
jgi:hypothetical protein